MSTEKASADVNPLRLGRFERRVLAAIAAVAFVPLAGALMLGHGVLEETFRIGVNDRIGDQLYEGIVARREWAIAVRNEAERTADAIAWDHTLITALASDDRDGARRRLDEHLAHFPHVVRIRIEDDAERALLEVERDVPAREVRQLELVRELALTPRPESEGLLRVRITLGAPARPFQVLENAFEQYDEYRVLLASGHQPVTSFYLLVYVALLLAVIVVALAVGIVVARGVTRSVVRLAEATSRVGRGDLTVEVPTDAADEVGELTRAFNAMVRDIRNSRDRIEYLQRVGAWQEMARRLAHEIKNPLTPIQLAVQELHRAYVGDDAKFRRKLDDVRDIIEEEVTTLRRLVHDFSEFARLPEPALAPADLAGFVREATRGLEPAALANERGTPVPGLSSIDLRIETQAEGPLPVRIDAQMLRRCLDNLVRNAVQAIVSSRANSGPGSRVIVVARRDGRAALLEVRDDGPGVPADARERVFDPYYTTRDDGTGLGLAIVKKVVLEHGGTIACLEAPEGGAAFQIRLPLANLESSREEQSA